MQCPFDGGDLRVVNRSGIEIDWCPSCKGVWLERGELDKLIDQASATMTPPGPAPMPAPAMAPAPSAAAPPPPRWGSPGSPDSPHWQQRRSPAAPYADQRPRDHDDDWDDRRAYGDDRRSRKRKSLLSEIFDF